MIAVTVPTTDVNSESAVIVRWYVEDHTHVTVGQPLAEIETSKAILDVASPHVGVLLRLYAEGEQLKIDEPLGYVFDSIEQLERHGRLRSKRSETSDELSARITSPARRRAGELGVDIDEIARTTDELVTTRRVDAFAAQADDAAGSDLPDPLEARVGAQRLLIIGAGLGATQIIDILLHDDAQQAVAIVDDDRDRFGDVLEGIPVVGGIDRGLALFAQGAFDGAVISISTSVPARTRLRQRCEQAALPLVNAIDPSARIAAGVRMGTGNVICALCHFGVGAVIGDNNFLSAYNSFDHHSELGSDISTGPGCMTSGLVHIGDRCRLGTGVFVEPHVTLGAGVQAASGAVIVSSVPPDHAVKTRLATTAVVPIR